MNILNCKKTRQIIALNGQRRRYIKEGIFPAEMSKMIGSAFMIRNASDYDDMFIASMADTQVQISNAEYILREVTKYIEQLTG